MFQKIFHSIFVLAISGLLIAGCASTGPKKLGAVAEKDYREVHATPQEEQQGEAIFQAVKQKVGTSSDSAKQATVRRVMNRLLRANPNGIDSWEFAVIRDASPNAFALPGGKVGVHEGMFRVAQTDTALAAVLSHEMAHVVARHHARAQTQRGILQGLGMALGVAVGVAAPEFSNLSSGLYQNIAVYGFALPYSRSHEMEADRMGLLFMARAGYDPREAEKFWTRMQQVSEHNQIPDLLSTHPADEKRIEQIRLILPEVMPYYQKTRSN
ncbi:MAG: M48 family metallopeptidase [Verrucomicrobiae bacterium]|nr:M48 family metallopeptidase [Verrucomicrobiae bacterium]